MKRKLNLLFTVIAFISFLLCDDVSAQPKKDKAKSGSFDLVAAKSAIDAANAKFTEAFRKGDSAAVAAAYTSDGWMLPPNGDIIKGSDIVHAWGAFIRMGVKDLKLTADEVTGSQDQLTEVGHYEIRGDQNAVWDKGKYIVVWKQENGSWKLHRDIWNSSMPAPAAK